MSPVEEKESDPALINLFRADYPDPKGGESNPNGTYTKNSH
jgi:hypothetical protein